MARNDEEPLDKLDVPQGTLDLMILTILTREPLHGYGISQRLTALSHDHFRVNPGSCDPIFGWSCRRGHISRFRRLAGRRGKQRPGSLRHHG